VGIGEAEKGIESTSIVRGMKVSVGQARVESLSHGQCGWAGDAVYRRQGMVKRKGQSK
jgi:hypothetical protein